MPTIEISEAERRVIKLLLEKRNEEVRSDFPVESEGFYTPLVEKFSMPAGEEPAVSKPRKRAARRSPEEMQEARDLAVSMYTKGAPYSDIRKATNLSDTEIVQAVRKAEVPLRGRNYPTPEEKTPRGGKDPFKEPVALVPAK